MIIGQKVSTKYGNGTIVSRCTGSYKGWFEIKQDNPEKIDSEFQKSMHVRYGSLPFEGKTLRPEVKL